MSKYKFQTGDIVTLNADVIGVTESGTLIVRLNGVLFDLVDENETLEGQVNELREQMARLTEKQNRKTVDVKLGGELIYRQAVLATLDNMDKALDEERTVEKYKELLAECIKVLPSVENKGEWIGLDSDAVRYDDIMCSKCKRRFTVDSHRWCDIGFTADDFKFCPNCGADMRGET